MRDRWSKITTLSTIATLWAGIMISGTAYAQVNGTGDNARRQQNTPVLRSVTLDETYLGLSMGPLRQAKLTALPKGLLLRTGKVEITEKQLTAEVGTAPAAIRERLKQNGFYVLENMAVRAVLLSEAHTWAAKSGRNTKSDNAESLTQAYLQSLIANVHVTEAEVRAFYDANPDAVGGGSV
ncbi:MAG TPA: hypothetical protein VHV83_02655 [Armatimonadota bacterium]|nr:hypothetical protein [Armatimonadota bacterium]